ncbi:MAG: choice-of-anchor Q domain-containing protein, partial [Halobacteriales archaeon]|nr:choice-of-anchor Q domain-containing protein [Halobacteriales archaeon]
AALDGTALHVSNSVFRSNQAGRGGAIASDMNEVRITGSSFLRNEATVAFGRAGAVETLKDLTICGTLFEGNTSGEDGGAVSRAWGSNEPTWDITYSQFVDNDAGESGGAVFFDDGVVRIEKSAFVRNRAGEGGAVAIADAEAEILNSTFFENTSRANGGALLVDTATLFVENSTLVRNRTQGLDATGAALDDNSSTVALRNSVFAGNVSSNPQHDGACGGSYDSLGGNVEFPAPTRADPCTEDVMLEDPVMAEADETGFTTILVPSSGSPAIGLGMGCPTDDQHDRPRPGTGCTSGAYEVNSE